MNKFALALAAAASALSSVPAMAAPASVQVRTADLNLSSPAGRETLTRRISFAAKRVCIVEGDRSLTAIAIGNQCYKDAVNAAHSKIVALSGSVALASN